jgi:flagellar biosynthetic protein FliP
MTTSFSMRLSLALAVIAITLGFPALATAQQMHVVAEATSAAVGTAGGATVGAATTQPAALQLPDLASRSNIGSTLQFVAILSIVSLAPAILLMVTSFTRIMIVLSLLRQALGAQQLPPNQVLVGLSMFMTFLVMAPTWQRVNSEALQPYLSNQLDAKTALDKGLVPVRQFMTQQIERYGNEADVDVFTDAAKMPRAKTWNDVPTTALIPAFMLSELKVAFTMGFRIFLPFVLIDLVVSMLLVSAGMMMMPPTLVSLPFKLLMFVLVDGWRLITVGLIGSFVG